MQEIRRFLRTFSKEPKVDMDLRTFSKAPKMEGSAVDQVARRVLPPPYQLAKEKGVVRFTTTQTALTPHRDIVLCSSEEDGTDEGRDKMFAVSLFDDSNSLRVADFKVTVGRGRIMIFRGASRAVAMKTINIPNGGTMDSNALYLSEDEQIAFLEEVANAKFDQQATQELSKIPVTF